MKYNENERVKSKKRGFFYDLTVRVSRLINILLITLPVAAAWYICYADKLWVKFAMRGHWAVIALYALLYLFIGRAYEAFKMSYNSIREMIYSQMLTFLEADIMLYLAAWLLIRSIPPVIPILLVFAAQTVVSILWCNVSKIWYFYRFPASKTIVVWDRSQKVTQLVMKYQLEKKFEITSTATVEECLEDLSILDHADTVFLAGIHSHDRNTITKYCLQHGIEAYLIPRIGDLILLSAQRVHLFHRVALRVERYHPHLYYSFTKRLSDIVLSLIAIILSSPIMLVVAICIKQEDHGPVIYRQRRLTKDGKEFDILKFRSMRTDAEKDGIARLSAGENDDRVTKVGNVLRRFRLDELPQLFNILKGDMSIVGPRAERPEIAEQYYETLPEFSLRLQMKAGLTGYAQVYGKYNTTPYDKLVMDMMYIASACIFEDIRIIFATVKILFMPESTEGVLEGQVTAADDQPSIRE